jgi:siroheme synthase-like protein
MAAYYPVFLNIADKQCIVIGGGEVALRKTQELLNCGATVVVVSPAPCRKLMELAGDGLITVLEKEFTSENLSGAFIVVVTTNDNSVNARVAKEAKERGIPVNVADNIGLSDFILPSLLRRGDITVAVSTSGKSPALARKLRTNLEGVIGSEYAVLAELISEVRTILRASGTDVSRDVWQEVLDLDTLSEQICTDNYEQLKTSLLDKIRSNPNVTLNEKRVQ